MLSLKVGESCSNDYLSGGNCSLECMEVRMHIYTCIINHMHTSMHKNVTIMNS